jgi:hypothetical protein
LIEPGELCFQNGRAASKLEAQAAEVLAEKVMEAWPDNSQFDGSLFESLGLIMIKARQNMPKTEYLELVVRGHPDPWVIKYCRDKSKQLFRWKVDYVPYDPWKPSEELIKR